MRRAALTGLLAVAISLPSMLMAVPAPAEFHLMSIREVFPGTSAQPGAEYVELQAYTSGQNFIAGHSVVFWNAAGFKAGTEAFGSSVPDGRNQMTVVMATPAAESLFGFSPADGAMAPGLIDPAGGAICWESLDCVSWGSFSGALPSPAGSPAAAAGIPVEQGLRRTIAPGCPTLLEPIDDSNNSAQDFSPVFPSPRPNSVVPSEQLCLAEGPTSQQGDKAPPQTLLRHRPPQRTRDRTPTFRFSSTEAGAAFECRIDRRPFRPCRSPFTVRRLALGRHVFRVRAVDAAGHADPSPASDAFRVIRSS